MNIKNLIKNFDKISAIYASIGFIFGSLIYYIFLKSSFTEINKGYTLLVIIIFFISNLLLIKIIKIEKIKIFFWKASLIFSSVISLIYYLLVKVNIENYLGQHYYHADSYIAYFNLSLIIIYLLSIIYFKSFLLLGKNEKIIYFFSYKNLANILANYNFTVTTSFLSLGATWLILFLWSMLFKLIDINFFYNTFFDTNFFPDVLSEYEGKETVLLNSIWIMGNKYIYKAIIIKDTEEKYKLIKEKILKDIGIDAIINSISTQ